MVRSFLRVVAILTLLVAAAWAWKEGREYAVPGPPMLGPLYWGDVLWLVSGLLLLGAVLLVPVPVPTKQELQAALADRRRRVALVVVLVLSAIVSGFGFIGPDPSRRLPVSQYDLPPYMNFSTEFFLNPVGPFSQAPNSSCP